MLPIYSSPDVINGIIQIMTDMAQQSSLEIRTGTCGWNHDAWAGAFYPDDLPDDWRLSYYSNEFDTVLVPVNGFDSVTSQEVEQWYEDTRDDFLFFIKLPDSVNLCDPELSSLLDRIGLLGARLGGILLPAGLTREQENQVARMEIQCALYMELEQQNLPDYVETALSDSSADRCHAYALHQPSSIVGASSAALSLFIVEKTGEQPYDLRKLRTLVEGIMAGVTDDNRVTILLGGHPSVTEDVRNIRIMADLMTRIR